jgi:glycosyltransferase involved in cell wall biosynthesis
MLVSSSVPPRVTGSAVIVGNLARQFSPREMIVVGEKPVGHPHHHWRAAWPKLVYAIWGWPPTWRGARWFRWLQLPLLIDRCTAIVRNNGVRDIVAVFPAPEFLFAGYIAACWAGARFFPYFHNTYVENRSGVRRRVTQWLQGRVFARAERVFVISEGMLDLYRARYTGVEFSVLPHSFNEGVPAFEPPPSPGSPISLVISGNVNESCRDATVRVSRAIAQHPDAELLLLSGTQRSFLERLGMLREGVRHATVARDDLLTELRRADIVVLPHGFSGTASDEEYETIFPTRTIEYLICGRPILAHSPPNCYLTRFLRRHDCALVIDVPDTAMVVEGIDRLQRDADLRGRLVRNALRAAHEFHAPRVAGILRQCLDAPRTSRERPSTP